VVGGGIGVGDGDVFGGVGVERVVVREY